MKKHEQYNLGIYCRLSKDDIGIGTNILVEVIGNMVQITTENGSDSWRADIWRSTSQNGRACIWAGM